VVNEQGNLTNLEKKKRYRQGRKTDSEIRNQGEVEQNRDR
jgi:hypothetical protein